MKIAIVPPPFIRDAEYLATHRKFILRMIANWHQNSKPMAFTVPLKGGKRIVAVWADFTFSYGERHCYLRLHYDGEGGLITEQKFHILKEGTKCFPRR